MKNFIQNSTIKISINQTHGHSDFNNLLITIAGDCMLAPFDPKTKSKKSTKYNGSTEKNKKNVQELIIYFINI